MTQNNIYETVEELRAWLAIKGYSKGYISQFNSTINQLLNFMNSNNISLFNTDVSFKFMQSQYKYTIGDKLTEAYSMRVRVLQMLSEFQLHGTAIVRTKRKAYIFPEQFKHVAESFIAYRKYIGIVDRSISAISLYLERFLDYLNTYQLNDVQDILPEHIQNFLIHIVGYSKASKDQMMRTVRQFMKFCFENKYHKSDLSSYAPCIKYEKRSKIPSVYSRQEVLRLIETVDRGNPTGKRDYAILLLISKLGLRSSDVANLKFHNICWDKNCIFLVQQKTGGELFLPLLEDVGLAIIEYLKHGRPVSDSPNVFLCHKPPINHLSPKGIYAIVSRHIRYAGLPIENRKHGPHSLRHSLASGLLEENIPLPIISGVLGHANTNTTATYLSIDINKLRNCALEV